MKYKSVILFLLAVIASRGMQAQSQEEPRLKSNADFAFRYGTGLASGSISYLATFGLGKKRKFHLGGGLRLALASGSDLNFETAPARLTGKSSTIDSVEISTFTTYSMNVFLDAEYEFSKRLNLGFNIDLAGFSWGSRKNGVFIFENSRQNITARPTPFNILLVGDNDIGSLNSELFVRFKWKQNLSVRGGISYLFTEFQTDKKYTFNNDRFRNKSMGGFVSISFLLPGKK